MAKPIRLMIPDFKRALKGFQQDLATDVEVQAAIDSPVVTGKLASSWSQRTSGDDIIVGNTAEYAAYVERGTATQAPQLFTEKAILKQVLRKRNIQ